MDRELIPCNLKLREALMGALGGGGGVCGAHCAVNFCQTARRVSIVHASMCALWKREESDCARRRGPPRRSALTAQARTLRDAPLRFRGGPSKRSFGSTSGSATSPPPPSPPYPLPSFCFHPRLILRDADRCRWDSASALPAARMDFMWRDIMS